MLILKGFIIGIGKVLPGISGSVLAISMGVYDKIINSFSNFFKDVKKNFLFLIQIFIGISLAILLGTKLVSFLINHFYIITMFVILGFIMGTIPRMLKKINYSKKNVMISVISFLCTFALNHFFKLSLDINFSTIIFLGIIEAFTSIVPGISGTVIFVNMGVYGHILNSISNLKTDFLFFYIIGILIGIIIFSKLISFLLDKCENEFSSIISGLLIASIIPILKKCLTEPLNQIIIGLILFAISFTISYLNT